MLIDKSVLPTGGTAWQFEGYLHDQVAVSFFISETPSGRGPALHKHPYPEVFIVLDGELTFTAGEATLKAVGGQVVTVPAETPHKFFNSGVQVARHVDIHVNDRMVTTWLEK